MFEEGSDLRLHENAKIIRAMIDNENNLLNYRINWLVTIQGLLFAALGFSWDKKDARGLLTILCLMGIMMSISAMTSFLLATQAMGNLLEWWKNNGQGYKGPEVQGLRAEKYRFLWLFRFLYPWHAIPFIFILAWICVLIINLTRS